jgi:hypothetical protein
LDAKCGEQDGEDRAEDAFGTLAVGEKIPAEDDQQEQTEAENEDVLVHDEKGWGVGR